MDFPKYILCPQCKNKHYTPTPEMPRPVINLGKKEYFGRTAHRRYSCLQCGYVWVTKEEFYREVDVRIKREIKSSANIK